MATTTRLMPKALDPDLLRTPRGEDDHEEEFKTPSSKSSNDSFSFTLEEELLLELFLRLAVRGNEQQENPISRTFHHLAPSKEDPDLEEVSRTSIATQVEEELLSDTPHFNRSHHESERSISRTVHHLAKSAEDPDLEEVSRTSMATQTEEEIDDSSLEDLIKLIVLLSLVNPRQGESSTMETQADSPTPVKPDTEKEEKELTRHFPLGSFILIGSFLLLISAIVFEATSS